MIGDLLFLITFGAAFTALGSASWRILACRFPRRDEWLGIALPLGLGLGGSVIGIAAASHSFTAGIVLISLAMAASACMLAFVLPGEIRKSRSARGRLSPAVPGLSAIVIALIVPGLFAPVIDGDALCYHLEVAKRMVQDDFVHFDPDLHETAYPLVVESLQAIALKFRGPIATRAVSFWFGIGLASAAACLAGSIVKGPSRYWAAALVLITPVVHCGMISPLNDVALAALCTSSLAVWIATEPDTIPTWRRVALAGSFCGLACGVKFPGIVWLAVFSVYAIHALLCGPYFTERFSLRPDSSRSGRIDSDASRMNSAIANFAFTSKHMAIFMSAVLIFGSFWYVRAAILTGNPVHPYFRNTFGGNGLDEVLEDARKPLWSHALNIATAPAAMALFPSWFDSFSHQSGPLFLALIPLGFLRKSSHRWKSFVLLGWMLMALCLTQRQSPRFFIASFAFWAAACAKTIEEMTKFASMFRPANRSLALVSAGCLCLLAGLVSSFDLARIRVGALVLTGLISPHDWLISNEPTARLSDWTSETLPTEARLIGQDHRAFYWPRRFTMEKAHRRRTGLLTVAKTPGETIEYLQNQGFTHLVMAEPAPIEAVEFDTDLSMRLEPWMSTRKPLIDVTLPEIDGYVRRYRIFAIAHRDRSDGKANRNQENDAAIVRSRSETRNPSIH